MIGTLVNAAAILAGGTIGLIFKKNMPERITSIYFQAVGLFTMAIGISMVYTMHNILIVVGSLAFGAIIGEGARLEERTERLSSSLKTRFRIANDNFTEGVITSFLLFCMGSMTILGAIQEGTGKSSDLLMTKSMMDGFSAMLLASAFGVGVIASIVPLLIFQGGITLMAQAAGTFLTPVVVEGLSSVGGILLIGLSINILEIKKLRIMNMLPALVLVAVLLSIFK